MNTRVLMQSSVACRRYDAARSRPKSAADSSEFNRTSNLRGLSGVALPILEQQLPSGSEGLIGIEMQSKTREKFDDY